MKIPVKFDPIPTAVIGPRTVQCTECTWEGVWIVPEEVDLMIAVILEHIQQHGIQIPQFLVTLY